MFFKFRTSIINYLLTYIENSMLVVFKFCRGPKYENGIRFSITAMHILTYLMQAKLRAKASKKKLFCIQNFITLSSEIYDDPIFHPPFPNFLRGISRTKMTYVLSGVSNNCYTKCHLNQIN